MLAALVQLLLANLVVVFMLGVGLAARPRDLADVRRRPWLYARALAVMWIGVPLWTMAMVALFDLRRVPAEALLLVAVCPGAPLLVRATRRRGERFSVVGLDLLLLTALMAPVLVPAWVAVLDRTYRFDIAITPLQVFVQIMPDVVVPLAAGLAIGHYAPRLARALLRPVQLVFFLATAVAAVVVLWYGGPLVLRAKPALLLAALLVVAGSALMGYAATRSLAADRRAVGTAAAFGNPGLVLAVVAVSHPGYRAPAFVFAYLLVRKLALILFERWALHRERSATATSDASHHSVTVADPLAEHPPPQPT